MIYLSLGHLHVWVQVQHLQQGSGATFPHTNDDSSRLPLLGGIVGGGGGGRGGGGR